MWKCECPCVCVNFNVEKRARNYRKKHLCRGKIIKSIHTHNLGKALLLALLPTVRGEKPVGTENQFQFVFPADTVGKSAETSERARGKLKISNSAPAPKSSICIWFSAALIFSDFPTFSDSGRRRLLLFLVCAAAGATTSGKLPTPARTEKLKEHAVKWKFPGENLVEKWRKKVCQEEKSKKCKFLQPPENFASSSHSARLVEGGSSFSSPPPETLESEASKFSRPQLRK